VIQGVYVKDFPFLPEKHESTNSEDVSFGQKEFGIPLVDYLRRVDPMGQEARMKLRYCMGVTKDFS
jgi:hypothetical protein